MADDLTTSLRGINRTRGQVETTTARIDALGVELSGLLTRRDQLLGEGAAAAEITRVERQVRDAQDRLDGLHTDRDSLVATVAGSSDGLARLLTPENLVATLDGRLPVAMLPMRIETRFASATKLRVRVFPDQLHIDTHDPALTTDEREAGRWYWTQRWDGGLEDLTLAEDVWRTLVTQFRPGRAAYLVEACRPTNPNEVGSKAPRFPDVPLRALTWNRAAEATALPDRVCVVGMTRQGDGWVEQFRQWGRFVPDRLPVGPSPRMKPADQPGKLPVDEGVGWLHDPAKAEALGLLVEVEHPSLAAGVDRLLVLGVDWTQTPQQAAAGLSRLLTAQRYAGHLGFVSQGTPTNNTDEERSGFTTETAREAEALAPHRERTEPPPGVDPDWTSGRRLAAALGIAPDVLADVAGADDGEQAWGAALTDVLWRASAGSYLADMLDPIADGPQVDANLREFTRHRVFATGPFTTLRVGKQPFGVLPVVAAGLFETGADAGADLVHRVVVPLRSLVTPAIETVPHLRRAGEGQDVEGTLLRLLQRTPVPWSLRFRSLTGPVQRRFASIRWDLMAQWQTSWTATLWSQLGEFRSTRLQELTLGADHPLPVPLVARPGEADPTSYLEEIRDLMSQPDGRVALNLREDSLALLEALAACSAVLEMDRAALSRIRTAPGLVDANALARLPALRAMSIRPPDLVRIEPATRGVELLDFRTGRQLADTVVPQLSPDLPIGKLVAVEFADKLRDLDRLLGAPTDPHYWMAHQQQALTTLAAAPAGRLEWVFRGWLDLFSTRLDAWFTGLATKRLEEHRAATPSGVHVGCWGVVEDLRHDATAAGESLGFVHAPSPAQATTAALLRTGRLANSDANGLAFDLQVTSPRVRRATWLLDGVAQGQRLAALLGYRIERRLRETGLDLMRYQLPLRRTAPLTGPDVLPETAVEVLAARDVVDGVTLLDRWAAAPDAVLTAVAAQAGLASLPAKDASRLRAVLDDVHDSYDAVSDLLVAESVHQSALGNLDRAGAALAAHDRHGPAPELDFIATPRSGHTVAHRVGIALQERTALAGWSRDARGVAEPRLDTWVSRVLGDPTGWSFGARLVDPGGRSTPLDRVTLADLGLGALSVALGTRAPGAGEASELEQRLAVAFRAKAPTAASDSSLELLADGPDGGPDNGLAALMQLGGWLAEVCASPALTSADLAGAADVGAGVPSPGNVDASELGARAKAVHESLVSTLAALRAATTAAQLRDALLAAVPYDGPDALPLVPARHPNAAGVLAEQRRGVVARLRARRLEAEALTSAPAPTAGPGQDLGTLGVARHTEVIRAMLGPAQPVLATWTLARPAGAQASLADRASVIGGDPTAVVSWLHRSALVRPSLDPLAGLLMHVEARPSEVADRLAVVQHPHRPGSPWLALPFDADAGPPTHGSVATVLHAWKPLDVAAPIAGLLVDGWTETVPADTETTAIAFHYDAPGARAPQAVLLAVHPARRPERWSFDTLLATVNEAVDLARLRTLSAAELAPLSSFLPALYLPDDYTHDVPSVRLPQLLLANEAKFSTVLGKA